MATFSMKSDQGASNSGGNYPPQKKRFEPIPEDEIVQAEILEVTLEEKPERWRKDSNDTHRVSFHFKVVDGPYANRHLWGNTSTWFSDSPKCRLRLWSQEALGLDSWPEGLDLDTESLSGKKVRVLVGNRQKQDGSYADYAKDILRSPRPRNSGVESLAPTEGFYESYNS